MITSQRTCFWALLSTSNLKFVYVSPSLETSLPKEQAILGTHFYDYLHPNEYSAAKRDISRSIEQQDLRGSVTRCRFRNIFLTRPLVRRDRKASIAVPQERDTECKGSHKASPSSPTMSNQKHSPRSYFNSFISKEPRESSSLHEEDDEYLVMDITLNVLCDGVVLGIFHPIQDEQQKHVCGQKNYSTQEIESWTQCVRYLSEQDRLLGHARNAFDVPLTPNTPQSPSHTVSAQNSFATSLPTNHSYSSGNSGSRVFFILDSETLSPLLCWPEETFCKLTGAKHVPPPGSRGVLEHHLKPEDLRMIKDHLAKAPPADGRLCAQSYSGKHGIIHMDGSLQYIQCIIIPYGSITFACFQPAMPLLSNFAAQQPLQLSLPPGKRHSPLNEKVLETKPNHSYTPLTSASSVSHLLNPSHIPTSEMPLTPCSPPVHGPTQPLFNSTAPGEYSHMYSYYPRNSHNRASLPSIPTVREQGSDLSFNANRRASEPHTTFARPRDRMISSMPCGSLSQIPENQATDPSSSSKRTSNEQGGATGQGLAKRFRPEHEDLRARVLGRNYSESDIFMPMDHGGVHRRHSSPVPHRELANAQAPLPPISQLVYPQPHQPGTGSSYPPSQPPSPYVMTTPVGVHSQVPNQFMPSASGHHTPPMAQGYTMTRGGVPISFLHSSTSVQKRCESCNTSQSPEWRRGPTGHKTLCNACGLRYSRSIARAGKQQQKTNPANASSNPPRPNNSYPETPTSQLRTSTILHPSYSHPVHVPSSLPSSTGNGRESR